MCKNINIDEERYYIDKTNYFYININEERLIEEKIRTVLPLVTTILSMIICIQYEYFNEILWCFLLKYNTIQTLTDQLFLKFNLLEKSIRMRILFCQDFKKRIIRWGLAQYLLYFLYNIEYNRTYNNLKDRVHNVQWGNYLFM